jgi:hypothetical protein
MKGYKKMAANYSNTYMFNAHMQALVNMLCDSVFLEQTKLSVYSRAPEGVGVRFVFTHGASFSSWGEDINIVLVPAGPNATQVYIHSECNVPTQIIDWGKNRSLVEEIYAHMCISLPRFQMRPMAMQRPAAQRRFCQFCGKPLAPDSLFCTACGKKL